MKQIISNQKGFALLHILPAFVLVAAIAFVGGNVYQTQQRKQDAAKQATIDSESKKQSELNVKQHAGAETEEKAVDTPAPATEAKPIYPTPQKTPTTTKTKTEGSYKTFSIDTTSAAIVADNVVLTAKLPGSYEGTCKALVKFPDGSNAMWFETGFGPADSCSINVSKAKLGASAEWRFYMYYHSGDGMTKGSSGNNTFKL